MIVREQNELQFPTTDKTQSYLQHIRKLVKRLFGGLCGRHFGGGEKAPPLNSLDLFYGYRVEVMRDGCVDFTKGKARPAVFNMVVKFVNDVTGENEVACIAWH